jgi:hypothetical protein
MGGGLGEDGGELGVSRLFAIHTQQIAVSPLVAIHSKNGRGAGTAFLTNCGLADWG